MHPTPLRARLWFPRFGPAHVHLARNESPGTPVIVVQIYLNVPPGGSPRIDETRARQLPVLAQRPAEACRGGLRLFAPELGGGALLDLGIYPVSFASLVLGVPARITAVSHPAFTGVDATTSMIFQYDSGAHAVLTTTLLAASGNPAAIYGTAARIEIDGWFTRRRRSA